MTKLPLVINFLLFQAIWFLSLLLETQAVIYNALIIGLMLYLSKQLKHDLLLILFALPIVLLAEYAAISFDLIKFNISPFPVWLVSLWIGLLLCVNTSMTFLLSLKLWQVFLVCMLFAPPSYLAGANFNVLYIQQPLWLFWPVYGALWACAFCCVVFINRQLKY
jgi:hypothetical protein